MTSEPLAAVAAPKKDYAECRLQIRQTNGQALVASFGAKVRGGGDSCTVGSAGRCTDPDPAF